MRDITTKPIVWSGVAIALTVAAAIAAVLLALHWNGLPPGGARIGNDPAAAPGLASAPQDQLARERREKEAWLRSSGWIDRDAGIAHIPIDRAMDMLVARQAKR